MLLKTAIVAGVILLGAGVSSHAEYDHHGFTATTPKTDAKYAKKRHQRVTRHRRGKPLAVRSRGVSLAGIVPALKAKTEEIVSACGSVVVSAHRHTRVRGSGKWSLHASGRAVDLQGNPACIYLHLARWPGGYSIDYGRVRHVHVSYGGREQGARFAHYRRKYAGLR